MWKLFGTIDIEIVPGAKWFRKFPKEKFDEWRHAMDVLSNPIVGRQKVIRRNTALKHWPAINFISTVKSKLTTTSE